MKHIKNFTIKEFKEFERLTEINDILGIFELFGLDGVNISVDKFKSKWEKIQSMNMPLSKVTKTVRIRGVRYVASLDYLKLSAGQFIDFQSYLRNQKIEEILSVFLIPKGKQYNTGYDIVKVQEDILYRMPISKALSLFEYFTSLINIIARGYDGIFGDDSNGTEKSTEDNPFIWLSAANNVSEVANIPLMETFALSAIEFLNLMSFVIYKNNKIAEEYRKQ